MKGIQGLIIAIVLGLIGAAVNLKYLYDQSKLDKSVSFVVVRHDKKIKAGETIRKEQLDTFEIPIRHKGKLPQIAFEADQIDTLPGRIATHDYDSDQLILRDDFRTTPPKVLDLKLGQSAVSVPIDPRKMNTALIIPRQTPVSFLMPRVAEAGSNPEALRGSLEEVGPFEVLSVGNRLGSPEAMKASGQLSTQESSLYILRVYDNQDLDKKISRVIDYLARTNSKPLDVVIHPHPASK